MERHASSEGVLPSRTNGAIDSKSKKHFSSSVDLVVYDEATSSFYDGDSFMDESYGAENNLALGDIRVLL